MLRSHADFGGCEDSTQPPCADNAIVDCFSANDVLSLGRHGPLLTVRRPKDGSPILDVWHPHEVLAQRCFSQGVDQKLWRTFDRVADVSARTPSTLMLTDDCPQSHARTRQTAAPYLFSARAPYKKYCRALKLSRYSFPPCHGKSRPGRTAAFPFCPFVATIHHDDKPERCVGVRNPIAGPLPGLSAHIRVLNVLFGVVSLQPRAATATPRSAPAERVVR